MISWRPLLRASRRGSIGVAIAAAVLLAPAPSPAQADTHTIVSLEFDDGWQDATVAGALLSAHGMHGTFFVISGLLGNPNRLTLADVHQLAADGNEIGGHTVDHPHLTTLSADDQQREICNDRLALVGDGFTVTDLAYPYGQFDSTTEQVAAMCGYNSAREVGGVGCTTCPAGEAIPPPDPYRTRTEPGATSTTPVETLEGYVTQAEQTGGGWVQIVFHQICDGCGIYGVTADELSQFLDWLEPRSADGTTTATVSQVIGGGVKPAVAGPPITPPSAGIVPIRGLRPTATKTACPTAGTWPDSAPTPPPGHAPPTPTPADTPNASTSHPGPAATAKPSPPSTTAPAHQPSPPAPPTTPTNGSPQPHPSASSPTPETPTAPGHSGQKHLHPRVAHLDPSPLDTTTNPHRRNRTQHRPQPRQHRHRHLRRP